MKTIFKNSFLGLALAAVVLSSCKSDPASTPAISAADVTTTIEENPEGGATIGQVVASSSENTTFTLVSSEPVGAIGIDLNTGMITVADETAFDFETRQTVTAIVNVSNGETEDFSNVTINILDADDLLTLLTTSRAAYENTDIGWVEVTEEEYYRIAERLAEITMVGVSDFAYRPATGQFASNFTFSNFNNITIPFDHYLIAFRYTAMESTSPQSQVRPKVSEMGPITGFIGRGPLPPHSAGDVFFVSKGERVRTSSSQAYLAIYTPYNSGYVEDTSNTLYYSLGNSSDLPNTITPYLSLQQGLTTSVRQWD